MGLRKELNGLLGPKFVASMAGAVLDNPVDVNWTEELLPGICNICEQWVHVIVWPVKDTGTCIVPLHEPHIIKTLLAVELDAT